MDDFYAARSGTIPPLPWTNFAPPIPLFEGNLIVGQEDGSDGTVHIGSGSTAQIREDIRLGEEEGSTGAMTVTGNGTIVEAYTSNDYDIRVGLEGTGTLAILDGALVKDVDSVNIGAESTLTVDDATLEVTDRIEVGDGDPGVGLLRILNGGTVTSLEGVIGAFSNDTGEVEIDGAGSIWTISDDLRLGLGEFAQGTLSISNAGVVEVGGEVVVGGNNSGSGIGAPVGTLNITDGGKLHSTHAGILGPMTVGYFDGATGAVTVTGDGSEIDMGGNALRIGHGGSGSLVVGQGATVLSHNGYIGNLASGSGEVTVTGNGSSWQMTNTLSVGYSGTGELVVSDGGVVSTTTANIGYNTASDGTVLVTGGGSELSVSGSLYVGRDGDGTLTVAEGGEVVADGIGLANSAGTTGTINIGAAEGDTAAGAGTMSSAPGLGFGSGAATLVFNHTDGLSDDYVFDIDLSSGGPGTHEILHLAGVTNYTGDGSLFTGTTTLSGGTLFVNDALGGLIDITGGTLGGTGTLGTIEIGSNGTMAPGNSIGTITVADIMFNPGSFYDVEIIGGGNVAGTHNDLIAATGTATLNGGTVNVIALDPATSYQDGQNYTILTASGTLTGEFDDATTSASFITPTVQTIGNTVMLTIAVTQDFSTAAQTYNQLQASGALDGLKQTGDALTVFNATAGLNEEDARRTFDLVSGEIHASGQHLIENTFSMFNRTLRQQGTAGIGMDAVDDVVAAPLGYTPTAQAAGGVGAIDDATVAYADSPVANAWLAPLGGRGIIEDDGNAATLDWWNAGLAGGYEGQIDLDGGNGLAGLGLGYIRSHGAVNARLSSFDADGFHIGAYGAWSDDSWRLSGSLAYAASHISTERNVVLGGLNRTAQAEYWAHSLGFSGEAAYDMDMGGGTTLLPLFTLDAGWSGHGGFTERGAGALNLAGIAQSWTRIDTGVGIGISHVVPTETGRLALEGRAVWEHAFADAVPSHSLTMAGNPTNFDVRGPAADRDRLRLGAGLAWDIAPEATLRASYEGVFSANQQNHTANIGLNIRF